MNHLQKKVNYTFALSVVGLLFFVIGFALGINGLLIPYLQKAFSLSSAESYLVLTSTFGAFVLFGYPAGILIKHIGYKKSMVTAFLFFAIGLYLFIPSAKNESFVLFLIASFISGVGNTVLQAAVNPYVTICGPIESATRRISIMGILNKSGWAVAPVFLALFMDLSQSTVQLSEMYLPFYIIAGVFVLLGIFTYIVPLPEIAAAGEDETQMDSAESAEIVKFVAGKKNVFQFPHLLLGVLLLFLYVGVETITLATPVDFANTTGLNNPQIYPAYTVVAQVLGYLLGAILIPKAISQHRALIFCAASGVVFSLLAVLVPVHIAIYFVALMGFSNSLIWGPVWPLAISYLGKYTKSGASLLVTAIVGGAVLPLVFGWLKDFLGDIQQAYWICVPFYIYVLYYAFRGYKTGLKEILNNKMK
ncbi:MAG: glucose/galactose MFS transporter [Bacteroidales bacterium]|jgi:glucose/galactose transporter|nr:glucose/galactose MFS transporter [Bacteroidales bacterium]